MALIGMTDAAKIAGISGADAMRTSLINAGIILKRMPRQAWGVEEEDLTRYINERGGELKQGRPKKEVTA